MGQRSEGQSAAVRKQNLTVQLDRETVRKAKVLAAQRGTSVTRLVAATIERMVGDEEAYEVARQRAMTLIRRGLHLGGRIRSTRDEWHER